MERHNGLEQDPEGAFVYHDDAQVTIVALQKEIATRDSTDSILATRIRELESRLTQRTAELEAANKHCEIIEERKAEAYKEVEIQLLAKADLQAELERVRDQFADLRKMVAALPKVEGEIYEVVASYRYDKVPEAWFHCEDQLTALLKHRQGMEG